MNAITVKVPCQFQFDDGGHCWNSSPDDHVHRPPPCANGSPERHHDYVPPAGVTLLIAGERRRLRFKGRAASPTSEEGT